jgi:hypothetical protein
MNALIVTLQAIPGGVGTALMLLIFRMWHRGDLVPKAVVEMMEAARKEDREQAQLLMAAVIDALERGDSRPRHGRDL